MHRDRAIFPRAGTTDGQRFFTIPARPFEFTVIRIAVARKSLQTRVIRGKLEKPSAAIGDTSARPAAVDAYLMTRGRRRTVRAERRGRSISHSFTHAASYLSPAIFTFGKNGCS